MNFIDKAFAKGELSINNLISRSQRILISFHASPCFIVKQNSQKKTTKQKPNLLSHYFFLNLFCPSGRSCGQFEISLPQTVQVLRGSCVTVPCSFDLKRKYEQYLNGGCRALWVYTSSSDPRLTDTNPVTGNLTEKNCTTTFSNMQRRHANTYNLRLDCNGLKYTFKTASVTIEVRDNFPPPTLTPSTLLVKNGDSVSLTCSALVPCLFHPPNLTWTPTLHNSQVTLLENRGKTPMRISVLNFTASRQNHGQISCSAAYQKQDESRAVTFSTRANIQCELYYITVCETTANQVWRKWLFNGQPVSQSKVFVITDSLNGTYLRSTIAVNQLQEKNLSSLVCFSFNSLGSDSKQLFIKSPQVLAENRGSFVHLKI
uniref:Ig-like domain-containing protein n=1 Tax=Poecilia latipinna TaxID=48699 RepID=A0A3B3VC30_9TELE